MNLHFVGVNVAARRGGRAIHALASVATSLMTIGIPTVCLAQSEVGTAGKVHTPAKVPSADSWPRFLGHSYDGSATVHDDLDLTKTPEFVWSIDVGDGYGICSVEGGRLFQMDAGEGTAETGQRGSGKIERQRCFDLETGRLIWSQSEKIEYRDMLGYEDGPRSSPTIVGDRVYTQGVTGLLTCRNTADGTKIWMVDTHSKYGVVQNFFGVASAPLVIDDQVMVMVGGSPAADQNFPPMRLDRVTANGSALVAFNRHNGEELWKCGDDLASYSSPIPFLVEDGTTNGTQMVLLFARSGLMAIDPKAAKVRWKLAHRAAILESVNGIVPLVDGQHIFISECYEVGSVLLKANSDSAKVVWQDPPRNRRLQAMRCHWSTPVLIDGYLYGCNGRNAPDSDFRCLDFMTGKVMWNDSRRIRSAVTRLGDHLLVLEERGFFQVLKANPERLELVAEWDFSEPEGNRPALGYPCWSAPIVVGKKLIIRGTDRVVCLEFATREGEAVRDR
jgi:outer membrane protein assembly factor BamB